MKGILLAGGSGTRLYPLTQVISKQLLPVFDKPMIYYPLTTLMLTGIRDILVISDPPTIPMYKNLLGNGDQFGISVSYATQEHPNGIAEALLIGEEFIADDPVALILGDNLFFGEGLPAKLQQALKHDSGATVFGYWVEDPERYGVLEFDKQGQVIGIHEKPDPAPSNYAVTGMYFYDNDAPGMARQLTPSARGELEITDLNRLYLNKGKLNAEIFGRGMAWLDTGTHEALLEASQFVEVVEKRQGLKIACPEEIAWRMGFINEAQLEALANAIKAPRYRDYLLNLLYENPISDFEGYKK